MEAGNSLPVLTSDDYAPERKWAGQHNPSVTDDLSGLLIGWLKSQPNASLSSIASNLALFMDWVEYLPSFSGAEAAHVRAAF